MTPKEAPKEQAAAALMPLDDIQARDRRKKGSYVSVRDPAFAQFSREATEDWADAGSASVVGHRRPSAVQVGMQEADKSIPLVPARTGAPHSIEMGYDGNRAQCNLIKLFTALDLEIPRGMRMQIAVSYTHHAVHGPCVMLHLKEATFVSIHEQEKEEQPAEPTGE